MKSYSLFLKVVFISLFATGILSNVSIAQVATIKNWTNIYHGTSQNQLNLPYTVPAGSNANRVLVVAVSASKWTAGQITVTMSYGGQDLTLANGDMSTSNIRQHTALYYLDEAGLDAAANSTLSATVSAGGTTMVNTDIWAAVFDYVNQTSPLTDTKTYSSGTSQVTNFQFSPALTINAYNQAAEVVNSYNPQANIIRTINYAFNWTMVRDSTALYNSGLSGASIRNGVANRVIPNSNTTDVSPTSFSGNALASMTALSLNYETPPPPTVQTSNVTFSDITTSSFTINWTSGNGTNRIVLVKEGSAVDSDPVNGITYTAGNLFESGSEIGNGNYVVYNGMGYNVNVFNLDANTTYYVAVYEFSGPPGLETYLLTDPARGSQLTAPETAVTDDYRSYGSGSWGTAETWQTFDGASWVTAGSPPNSSSGVITIRNGHTITVAETVTADQVVVEVGAQLTVESDVTLTIADGTDAVDCSVNGTLNNSGTVTTTGVLSFNTGSTYRHTADGGTIPAATWDANSTCLITGITAAAPSGFGQSFGNFTWSCVSQTVPAAMNSDVTVKGNFRITSTGSGQLAVIDNNTSRTITVTGNYFQTAGSFVFNNGSSSSATAYLYVAGNFFFTGGSITELSSGRGSVIFNGNGNIQMYTSGGTLSNTIDFTVSTGAYLQMGTGSSPSVISLSNGTFTLSSGATLGITSPQGITAIATGSTGGNIRVTGTRTFDTGANYFYNGSVSQNTGDGLPLTVNSLVFNNSGGKVTFSPNRNITVTNDFSITVGSIANLGTGLMHSTGNLILGGTGQAPGSYGGSGSGADYELPGYFEAATGIVNNAPPDGTWTGITNTDWNTDSNWIGGVPTSQTDGTISSYTANQPVISDATTALCNSLIINSGASLTIAGSAEITTVESSGTLTITPGGQVTITTLTNSGTLNLQSDADGIASLILTTYTDNNGTENIELFLTGGGDESNYPWHYISSPVEELSRADVMSSDGDPEANDLAAYYENLVTDNKDEAWMGLDGWDYQNEEYNTDYVRNVLDVGRGYNYYSYYNATRVFGGKLNTGDHPMSLDCSVPDNDINGWNLLGNPFSSSLNWDDIAESLPTGGEIDNAIYFTSNNSVVSYVDGVGSAGDVTGYIPPMQGFFVKANASGQSITLPASARVHSTRNRYKGTGEKVPLIRLKIESRNASDEAVIRFSDKSSYGFDSDLDAYKFIKTGTYSTLWTMIGKVSYSINSIPFPETGTEIPLGMNITKSGSYKLTASQLEGLDNYIVYLTDKSTGLSVNLKSTPELNFSTSNGMLTDRFIIKVADNVANIEVPVLSKSLFNIYDSFDMINIQTLSDDWDGEKGSVSLIDMTGRTVININNAEFWKNSLMSIPAGGLKGLYFVKIQSGLRRYVGKIVKR